jgi:hypothetical protein
MSPASFDSGRVAGATDLQALREQFRRAEQEGFNAAMLGKNCAAACSSSRFY